MRAALRLIVLFLYLLLPVQAEPELRLPETSRQLVVVRNESWDSPVAMMHRFERVEAGSPWRLVGKPVAVNLGRTGLAWGSSPLMGSVAEGEKGGRKVEGDGRSPAGLFPILKAFGHPAPPDGYSGENLPFLVVSDEHCVDDTESPYYNQVVDPDEVGGVSWRSSETMKIDLYRLGMVIGHNCPKATPGLGSCIFFHLQRGPKSPTAGCTSMAPEDLRALALWLKRDHQPVLVQVPRSVYRDLKAPFPRL